MGRGRSNLYTYLRGYRALGFVCKNSSSNVYSNVIEKRLDDNIELENIINDNETFYKRAVENNQQYFLIDDEYKVDIEL